MDHFISPPYSEDFSSQKAFADDLDAICRIPRLLRTAVSVRLVTTMSNHTYHRHPYRLLDTNAT